MPIPGSPLKSSPATQSRYLPRLQREATGQWSREGFDTSFSTTSAVEHLGTAAALFGAYIRIYDMTKTIRVSDDYHAYIKAHKRDDETMEETLRRLTRGPRPEDVAGLLSPAEAEEAKVAVKKLRARDRDRFSRARDAFEGEATEE